MTYKTFTALAQRALTSPYHFLALGFYFVFRLYVHNVHGIPFRDLLRPLFLSLLGGMTLFLCLRLLTRKPHAAALMTSAALAAFFTFDAFLNLAFSLRLVGGLDAYSAGWLVLVILLLAWLGWKTPAAPQANTLASVNLMAIILLLFPAVDAAIYAVSRATPLPLQTDHALTGNPPAALPDIYYIILDAYPRADVLAEQYGYDNTPFLQSLKDLGFYVAECSQSNYSDTAQSLSSSLNLDYVQTISDSFIPEETELLGLMKLLDDNAVQRTVTHFGYQTVSFSSGFLWAEWRDADLFLAPPEGAVTEFETEIMFSTPLRLLGDKGIFSITDLYAERFRARTRFVLDGMADLPARPGPKFVFIHLIVPHVPFAFDENGNPAPPRQDPRQGYLNQVKFINKFILPQLRILIERSPSPPIVILQGDHGPQDVDGPEAQMKNLSAYYLPRGSEVLYPSITPVNSFRVVFNEYFGADLPLLDDVSYYSHLSHRYDYTVMPGTCP